MTADYWGAKVTGKRRKKMGRQGDKVIGSPEIVMGVV